MERQGSIHPFMPQERFLNLPVKFRKKAKAFATLKPLSLRDLRNFSPKGMDKNMADCKQAYQDLLTDPQLQAGTSCANISSQKHQQDSGNAKQHLFDVK